MEHGVARPTAEHRAGRRRSGDRPPQQAAEGDAAVRLVESRDRVARLSRLRLAGLLHLDRDRPQQSPDITQHPGVLNTLGQPLGSPLVSHPTPHLGVARSTQSSQPVTALLVLFSSGQFPTPDLLRCCSDKQRAHRDTAVGQVTVPNAPGVGPVSRPDRQGAGNMAGVGANAGKAGPWRASQGVK